MTSRAPLRVPPLVVVPVLVACVIFFTWVLSFSPWRIVPFSWAAQAYLLLAILLAFRYWPPMTALVKAMPVPHRIVAGLLLGAMILGHFTIRGREYYPFIVWEIFPHVHEVDPVEAREFVATLADGKKVRLLAEQQFPSIVQIDPLDALDRPEIYPPGTIDLLAQALAKEYNRQHPDNPVRHVDLMQLAVKLHPPATESRALPSCELLKRYDISSDR